MRPPVPDLSLDLQDTLRHVGRVMADAEDAWCLIGGTAALVHGVPVEPLDDIDVLLTPADASRLLPRHGIEPTPDGGTGKFRSQVFSRYRGCKLQVDFLGGLQVRSGTAWVLVPPAPKVALTLGQTTLWLASVEDLIAMHRLFDRPKDARRIRELSALLSLGSGVNTKPGGSARGASCRRRV
jgi:hypothetical protein